VRTARRTSSWKALFAAVVTVTSAAVVTALTAMPAQASTASICTTNAPSNGCMNRDGGGTGNGTPIIFWHNDGDANNNFAEVWLSNYCGLGTVSQICPFNDHSVGSRYFGAKIYELAAGNVSGKCVAASSGWNVQLWPCGNTGYVFVRSSLGYLVSVGASNHFGGIMWLTGRGEYGEQLGFTPSAFDVWTGP
jgi:hypothetical protein